jgi:hypothetical protein
MPWCTSTTVSGCGTAVALLRLLPVMLLHVMLLHVMLLLLLLLLLLYV